MCNLSVLRRQLLFSFKGEDTGEMSGASGDMNDPRDFTKTIQNNPQLRFTINASGGHEAQNNPEQSKTIHSSASPCHDASGGEGSCRKQFSSFFTSSVYTTVR
jgi:hypothetical protein